MVFTYDVSNGVVGVERSGGRTIGENDGGPGRRGRRGGRGKHCTDCRHILANGTTRSKKVVVTKQYIRSVTVSPYSFTTE